MHWETAFFKNLVFGQLEKYVKNLKREQLKLSIMEGHVALKNCDLDEDQLSHVLGLPAWIRLVSATCNHLTVETVWSELWPLPVSVHLDEVCVVLETCAELRTATQEPSRPSKFTVPESFHRMKSRQSQKICDGVYMRINAIHIKFTSHLMLADIQLLKLQTYPTTPEWRETDDIGKRRVENSDLNETLIFRQIDFESSRVGLRSIGQTATEARPIVLDISAKHIRLIKKRRLSDAVLLNYKVDFLLDKVQLILSETELRSTIDFIREITSLIEASHIQTDARKAQQKVPDKQNTQNQLNPNGKKHNGGEHNAQIRKDRKCIENANTRYYNGHAIWETSQHLLIRAFDLNVVHDSSNIEASMRTHQQAHYAQGSMSMHSAGIRIDNYPFRIVTEGSNSRLTRHPEASDGSEWIIALLMMYCRELGSKSSTINNDHRALLSDTVEYGTGQSVGQPVTASEDLERSSQPHEQPVVAFDKDKVAIPENATKIAKIEWLRVFIQLLQCAAFLGETDIHFPLSKDEFSDPMFYISIFLIMGILQRGFKIFVRLGS